MNSAQTALLELLRIALGSGSPAPDARSPQNGPGPDSDPEDPAAPACGEAERQTVLQLAERHKLLPVILDAAISLPGWKAAAAVPTAAGKSWTELALDQVGTQLVQENEFLNLVLALQGRGLDPLILKGPVCRALWPRPLLRPSVDDDLLIPAEQVHAYYDALLELGLSPDDPAADLDALDEFNWHKRGSPLSLELHKRLFATDNAAIGSYNTPFAGIAERAVPLRIQDVTLRSLATGDHLLFLLLHAFKHFLYSGFGLRVAADICLYARHYAAELDFDRIAAQCAQYRCERFAAAVFRIGGKYLDIPAPAAFAAIAADETALLEDMLDAGLHGAEIDRLHSANITLGAVADQNAGRRRAGGLTRTLFPGVTELSGRYPWLQKRPWLLPAAWLGRFGAYWKARGKYGAQSPAASLQIGRERVRLLEEYGVIDKK